MNARFPTNTALAAGDLIEASDTGMVDLSDEFLENVMGAGALTVLRNAIRHLVIPPGFGPLNLPKHEKVCIGPPIGIRGKLPRCRLPVGPGPVIIR